MGNKKLYPNTYTSWVLMRQRCCNPNNPDYCYYGGRGIKICDRWLESFENFLEDMGECPQKMSIERINNNKNYCKENCKWATRKEQSNNTRGNRILNFNGENLTVSQWSEKLNIGTKVILSRLKRHWGIERTLTEKIKDFEKKISYNGKTLTVKEWSKLLDIPCHVIRNRLNCSKWSIEKTLTTPSIKYNKSKV